MNIHQTLMLLIMNLCFILNCKAISLHKFLFILPIVEAKSKTDKDKEKNKQGKKKRTKQKNQTSKRRHFSLHADTSDEKEYLSRVVIQLTQKLIKQGLQTKGIPESTADDVASQILNLGTQAAEINKTTKKELEQIHQRKNELNKITQKSAEHIKELGTLKEQEEKILAKKNDQENSLGVVATGISHVLAQYIGGNKTDAAFTALCTSLEVTGAQYGLIAGKIAVHLIKAGRMFLNEESYNGNLHDWMKYYIITWEEKIGGWLVGQDVTTGQLYFRLDTPCKTYKGYVHIDHVEINLNNTYPYISIENQLAQIIAGDFEIGRLAGGKYAARTWGYNLFG